MDNNIDSRFFPESEDDKILEYVVKATFPNLNIDQQKVLGRYIVILIQYIATCFDFYSDSEAFKNKLEQNSYKDCRWLLTYLVPYINTEIKGFDELKDLNELYTLEYNERDLSNLPEHIQNTVRSDIEKGFNIEPISFRAPKYVFSNTQYGRFDRSGKSYKSINFDYSHIEQNFLLLLDTVKTIRYKMHINWIDIIPFRLDNYKESDLYISTVKKIESKDTRLEEWDPITDFPINQFDNPQIVTSFNKKVSGLNIEDIYNTISMDLYDSIVQIKWLLFDTVISIDNTDKPVPVLFILRALFSTKDMLEGTRYIELSEESKDLFEEYYKILIESYNKSTPITFTTGGMSIVIGVGAITTLVNAIVLFFDQKYSKIYRKDSTYIPIPEEIKRKNVDDHDQSRSYDRSAIDETLRTITVPAVYNFLVDVLEEFKGTWYSNKLLETDKSDIRNLINNEEGYNYTKIEDGLFLTYKNIYNFCKSLVHHQTQKDKLLRTDDLENKDASKIYTRYPKLWSGLDDGAKNEFTKRINGEYLNHLDWFNIYWNLFHVVKLYAPSIESKDVRGQIISNMKKMYDVLKTSIIGIVFESMITRGTMTQMVAKIELTNAALFDTSDSTQKRALVKEIAELYFNKKSPYMSEAYYYLTNKPFDQTTPHKIKVDEDIEKYDYMKVSSNPELAAYLATAYHWVAQVGFCHKFIHNRVNYITGATGAGKSTQIPKMYVYYLKSIDRIDNATVVVTVPRTNVAEGVSDFISKEMALPYEVYDENDEKHISENYTVQFKHRRKKHIKNGKFPKIRFVTDGSVINDIKDPLVISKTVNKKNNYVYGRSDQFHVIIVDEAHEHNANMDMILSMAKNTAFYNNRFRLVIMSATMGDDEPVYRRFYRDINDNRKYPLNSWIAKHKLDRINTERRFHISPPDVGTRFKIDEIYRPGGDVVEIVREITSNSSEGEILVFQPGSAEINTVVEALNKQGVMPPDVIALPYHAKIPSDRQDIVKGIHKELSKLKLDKTADFTRVDPYSGMGSYKRAVIVSTNISEASITYPSLKYVVETGIEKTMVFDYQTRTNVLHSNFITDASRLQRKGRVGRRTTGTVYYTYPEGSMEFNRKQFNISVQDIHLSIFLELIRNENDLPIFTPLVIRIIGGRLQSEQPLKFVDLKKQIESSYREISSEYDKEFVNSIIDLIEDLYTSNGFYYPYVGLYYSDTTFSKVGREFGFPYPLYFSGYDVERLTDTRGVFYIVHPDELSIDRNIDGDIVSSVSDVIELEIDKRAPLEIPAIEKQIMKSNKMKVFWSTLIDTNLCSVDGQITKTGLGSILQYAMSNLTEIEDIYQSKMLVMAYGLSSSDLEFDMILSIVAYLAVTQSKPRNMFEADPVLVDRYQKLTEQRGQLMSPSGRDILNRTKALFCKEHCYSDLMIISDVVTMIDNIIRLESTYSDIQEHIEGTIQERIGEVEGETKTEKQKADLMDIVRGVTDAIGIDDVGLEHRQRILDVLKEGYIDSVVHNLEKRAQFLKDVGLNMLTFSRFIKMREDLRQKFRDMVNDVDGFKRTTSDQFKSFADIRGIMIEEKKNMISNSIGTLKGALLLTLPYSLVRKIDCTKYHYVSVYAPSLSTMYSIGSTSRNYYNPDTYVDSEALQEYVHYIESNTDLATIAGLTRIVIDDLKLLSDIYNSNLTAKDYGVDESRDAIIKYTDTRREKRYDQNVLIPPIIDESDEYDAVNNVGQTVEKIKADLDKLSTFSTDIGKTERLERVIWKD